MLEAHLFRIETSSCGLFFSTPPSESEQKWDVNGPQCSESLKNSSLVLAFPQFPDTSLKRPASVFEERTVQWYKWQSRSLPLPSPFSFQIPYFLEFSGLTETGMKGRLRSGKKKLLHWNEGWGNPESLREAGTHCLYLFIFCFNLFWGWPSLSLVILTLESLYSAPGREWRGLWDCQGCYCVA